MARVKRGVQARKAHKKVLDRAKGYKGARSRRFRTANEQVMHAMQDAYKDRRDRKGQFRRLWIARINAAARRPSQSAKNDTSSVSANSPFACGANSSGAPSSSIVPVSGFSSPRIRLNSVDFPAPLGPTSPSRSVRAMKSDTSEKSSRVP